MKLVLKNVRLAFPSLWEKKSFGEGEPAYQAAFILPHDHPQVPAIRELVDKLGKEKWDKSWPTVKKQLEAGDKGVLHDGDTKANLAGYEGNLFINARNKERPLILDQRKNPLSMEDGKPYGGCYVNAVLDIWAQDNQFGKRINASLSGVQFFKDGPAFSSGASASLDDFDELEADDEDFM